MMSSPIEFMSTGIPIVGQRYLNMIKRIYNSLSIFFDMLANVPLIFVSPWLLIGCLSTFLQSMPSISRLVNRYRLSLACHRSHCPLYEVVVLL